MYLISLITLAGGLAFFLYGMHVMSAGLEKLAGGRLESAVKKMTSSRLKGLLLGAGITIAVQSSSAVTVMLVGLVDSGIMELSQTIGVIMGANIGTTVTSWLLSLVGIRTDNFFLMLLKPENFSLILAFIGSVLILTAKTGRKKDAGSILMGFAVLIFGMRLMADAVSPLAQQPGFSKLLVAFESPILGVLAGAVFTAVIQSSAASIGILQALALTGSVTYGAAIPIIMGQNIGTCATSLLCSIGVSANAKKVSIVHCLFNTFAALVCLALLFLMQAAHPPAILSKPAGALGIAAVHTCFNVAATAMLLPFSHQLEQLADLAVIRSPNVPAPSAPVCIGCALSKSSNAPAFNAPAGVSACCAWGLQMANLAQTALLDALCAIGSCTPRLAQNIAQSKRQLELCSRRLNACLAEMPAGSLSGEDEKKLHFIKNTAGDLGRLGDYAVNILCAAEALQNKGVSFAPAELDPSPFALADSLAAAIRTYAEAAGVPPPTCSETAGAPPARPCPKAVPPAHLEPDTAQTARFQQAAGRRTSQELTACPDQPAPQAQTARSRGAAGQCAFQELETCSSQPNYQDRQGDWCSRQRRGAVEADFSALLANCRRAADRCRKIAAAARND